MQQVLFESPYDCTPVEALPFVLSPCYTYPPTRLVARLEEANSLHARGWSRQYRHLLTTDDYHVFAKQQKAFEPWVGVEGGSRTNDVYLELGSCPNLPRY